MRNELLPLVGKVVTLTGTVIKADTNYSPNGKAFHKVLAKNVAYNGKFITDHQWVDIPVGTDPYEFEAGDKIAFTARIEKYTRSNGTQDVGVKKVSKIVRI